MNCISDFFTYETTKSVVVKSWTIGIINRAVQLLIISYFVGGLGAWIILPSRECLDSSRILSLDAIPYQISCIAGLKFLYNFKCKGIKSLSKRSPVVRMVLNKEGVQRSASVFGWVFLHEKAYQVRDTAIESSVVTKVKGFGRYANRVMDVSDYVTPPQGTSVFVIITKMIVTENQMQGFCPESEEKYRCVSDSQCGPERFPGGELRPPGILTGRCVNYSSVLRTCEIQGWCPTEVDTVEMPIMMEAENFTIFIKNSIRFPLFNFEKGNLLPNLTDKDIKRCRFHPEKAPFCPILRVGDVVKFAGQDFTKLARTGGVLGIKIGWVCDLDKAWDQCIPKYSFTRLDGVSEKSSVSPGYNFRPSASHRPNLQTPEACHSGFAKYYKMENGSEYRTLLKAFGIRFDVLVYGNAGKFNIIPTIISSVAAFTSVGVGTVLCDIILLNFLKGADHYKARKFEEVTETTLKGTASTNPVFASDQATVEKQSTDSGAYSIGH
ncbi:P2X purinoceptor 3 [Apodemus speciosus]|uniref:P2X purinoceptor n=1 Tax=Apodemus speciosus TaxID=105296 RepID=A0ABQ0EHJ3_APOSI